MPQMTLTQISIITLLQGVTAIIFIFIIVPVTIVAERKVLGFIQQRFGVTRIPSSLNGLTGWTNRFMWGMGRVPIVSAARGAISVVGDIIKMIVKEDVVPSRADKVVYVIAPAVSLVASVTVFSIICFYPGAWFTFPKFVPIIGGLPFAGVIADVNVGILFMLAVASAGVYGILLGAWASNSKYPLLGGLRGAAQMVSYEIPLGLSLLTPVVLSGSLNFTAMSRALAGFPVGSGEAATVLPPLAILPLGLGFLLYYTCGLAECNRLPFDMPECENELVAGFHTEYAGMKFGFYYLAEYINMTVVAAIASAFFLGGHYLLPFGLQGYLVRALGEGHLLNQPSALLFVLKIFLLLVSFIWVRGTIPRYRYDQIMALAWKYLLPFTLVNLALAALIRAFLA